MPFLQVGEGVKFKVPPLPSISNNFSFLAQQYGHVITVTDNTTGA